MTTRPYELLVRFTDGVPSGASVRYQEVVGDKVFDLDPQPLAGTNDPAFTAFAEMFYDGLQDIITQKDARIAELEAIIAGKEAEVICTNFQIRAWLIGNFGIGIIDQVTAMIQAIPDATQRLLAIQQWEYANNVLRDNPFVNQIASALGMTSEQMDAAYLEASKIV